MNGFGARFLEGQKRLYWSRGRGKVWSKSRWKWFKLLFCFILMNLFLFGLSKRKRAPKPLLGCQNWVTSTGGCQSLVPGWHSQRGVGGYMDCYKLLDSKTLPLPKLPISHFNVHIKFLKGVCALGFGVCCYQVFFTFPKSYHLSQPIFGLMWIKQSVIIL